MRHDNENWPRMGTDNFVKLMVLRHNPFSSSDNEFNLQPAKPYEWGIKFYQEAFTDLVVTKYLTISESFDPDAYITGINGPVGNSLTGSPNKALFHIYKRHYYQGPIGHVSLKEIDWEELSFHRGMVFKSEFIGQKNGPRVGFTVLDYMKKLGFRVAYTEVLAENERSLRVVEKQFGQGILKEDGYYHFKLDLTKDLECKTND